MYRRGRESSEQGFHAFLYYTVTSLDVLCQVYRHRGQGFSKEQDTSQHMLHVSHVTKYQHTSQCSIPIPFELQAVFSHPSYFPAVALLSQSQHFSR